MVLGTILRMARWLTKGLILNFFKKLKQTYTPILQAPAIFSLDQNNMNTKHVVERASIFFFFWGKGDCGWVARLFFCPLPLGDC
jgi:hypothetical protein